MILKEQLGTVFFSQGTVRDAVLFKRNRILFIRNDAISRGVRGGAGDRPPTRIPLRGGTCIQGGTLLILHLLAFPFLR